MAYYHFASDEQAIPIDPRLLSLECGSDDPFFREDERSRVHEDEVEMSITYEDTKHELVHELPIRTPTSILNPRAHPFRPAKPTNSIHRNYQTYLEATDPTMRPLTPQVEISHPSDATQLSTHGDSDYWNLNWQRRLASPVSRPSAKSQDIRADPMSNATAQGLIADLPANIPYAYNVGDRSVPLLSLQTLNGYPPTPPPAHSTRLHSLAQPGYRCTYEGCSKGYIQWKTKSELNHHARKHIPRDQRAHRCKHCESTFHFPKDLQRHMKGVHKEVCWVCEKASFRRDQLNEHLQGRHGIGGMALRFGSASPTPATAAFSPRQSSSTSGVEDNVWSTPHNLSSTALEIPTSMAPESFREVSERSHTPSWATPFRSTTPDHLVNAL